MSTLPGSLDGSTGVVIDTSGRQVSTFAIDDQRECASDPVYVLFEDPEAEWVARLAEQGSSVRFTLVWNSGHRLENATIAEPDPWTLPPLDNPGRGPILMLDEPKRRPSVSYRLVADDL